MDIKCRQIPIFEDLGSQPDDDDDDSDDDVDEDDNGGGIGVGANALFLSAEAAQKEEAARMKELPGHQQGGGDERKQGATTTTNANTGDHSHAIGTRIGQQMMLDLGQSVRAALNPELRLQRSATVQALLKTLHAEPAAGLAYFCTAAEVGGLQLLGDTLQICCKVRRCSCGLGLSCECPTDLVQPELLPLLQLLNQVLGRTQ